MATAGQSRGEEVCPRCTLAIKRNANRCPHCGERLHATTRLPLYAGIVGLLVLVFVAILMINTIGEEDANSDDSTAQQQTAQPDKPPPFNK